MNQYVIKYKKSYFDKAWRFITINAETPHDANMYFFEHHSGVIFSTTQLRTGADLK